MADELEELCSKISLTEGEKIGIQVEEGEIAEGRVVGGKCLVGKIWTDKSVNKEAFRTVLSTIWRTAGCVKFKELRDNVWLFEFTDEVDKRRVLDGRPWSFDRQILVLNEFDGSTPPSQMDFNHSPFWIQVHDMPLLCMNKSVGTKIGRSQGVLEEVDTAGDGTGWGSCPRLRVIIDITKPLDRGRALSLEGKSLWVEFKYEKLPLFCFNCGRIVHGQEDVRSLSRPAAVQPRRLKNGVWDLGLWIQNGEEPGVATCLEGSRTGIHHRKMTRPTPAGAQRNAHPKWQIPDFLETLTREPIQVSMPEK